jgi:alkaline phosphatase/streptomycin-6-phosphatase
VLLGGGRQRFDQTIDGGPDAGRTVTESAQRQGYQVVTDTASLDAAGATPLLGLFSAANMSLEWTGELARPYPGSGPSAASRGSGRRPSPAWPT